MKTQFVYIDSSEEEDNPPTNKANLPYFQKNPCPQHCSTAYNLDFMSSPETNYEQDLKNIIKKAEKDAETRKGIVKK